MVCAVWSSNLTNREIVQETSGLYHSGHWRWGLVGLEVVLVEVVLVEVVEVEFKCSAVKTEYKIGQSTC